MWKTFETSIFRSPKEKVFKVLRLIRGSGNGVFDPSQSNANQDQRQSETFNVEAYRISNQRTCELETQKAFVISLSRHERWKAGGPL